MTVLDRDMIRAHRHSIRLREAVLREPAAV
jgi:hypothetical protein